MADLVRLTEVIEPEAKALGFDLVRVKMMPSEAGDGGEAHLFVQAGRGDTVDRFIDRASEAGFSVQRHALEPTGRSEEEEKEEEEGNDGRRRDLEHIVHLEVRKS